jgi:hypothetical protein
MATPRNAREWAEEIKANPCTSYWLRQALKKLFHRNPLDAERDAELLHRVMQRNASEAVGENGR